MVSVAVLHSDFFSLILIWKFDNILPFKRPINVTFKTVKLILSGISSHFSDTTSSIEQNLPFTKLVQDFCTLSFFVLDTEGDLWRDCYSSLILKRLTILVIICVRTVRCLVWLFLECLGANKSLLVFWHLVVQRLSIVLNQAVSVLLLFLVGCNCSKSVIAHLRLVSIDHFTIEIRSFPSSFIDLSFWFILQLWYKVESSAYCMQLLFGVLLDMSATHRLNEIGPSIEPCSTPYLAVRRDEQFESTCTKCCLCVKQFKTQYKKSVEKFSEYIFCINVKKCIVSKAFE